MSKIDAKKVYESISKRMRKKGEGLYEESIHCPLVLDVMNTDGTMIAFCKKIDISVALFYKWVNKYPIFKMCYEVGKVYSRYNWDKEGEHGQDDPDFNLEHWRIVGACRYGVGRFNRVRLDLDANANPYEQYKQLIQQAGDEEFTASEIKQLMESINIGRGAYETFELQKMIEKMQQDVQRMAQNNGNHTSPIEKTTETD